MRVLLSWVLVASSAALAQTWSIGAWGVCSATCGGGTQSRTVTCVGPDFSPLPDSSCPAPKPAVSQTCNTQACATYSWSTSAWGVCSATCGGGTQSRTVSCVDGSGTVVSSTLCTGTPPATMQTCNAQACATYSWSTSAWGVCSATCGGGTQSRTVSCVDGNGAVVSATLCTGTPPATMQTCNAQACATYSWSTSAWGVCSATCGGGTQSRTVSCVDGNGAVVSATLCTGTPPATMQTCNTQACATYSWSTSAWGVCSATCGGGTQSRTVSCVDGSGAVVSSTLCTGTPPSTMQTCNTQACATYSWSTSVWGVCSATCGGGTQSRTVSCVDGSGAVVSATLCTGTPPATSQTCNAQACPSGTWMTGAWGGCSAACGPGTQSRMVACVDGSGAVLPAASCTAPAPASTQTCNLGACPAGTWALGAWGACSATCGGGTQSRTVSCVDGSGMVLASSACPAPAPADMQTCNAMSCPAGTWLAGGWSACDVSCGGGTQSRTVTCVDGSGAPLPATACMGTAPATTQTCNAQACVTGAWDLGAWSACGVSCGGGLQARAVRCLDAMGAVIADSACPQPRPATEMTCNAQACPVGAWAASAYGPCSAACGGGLRERTVTCRDAAGVVLPASVCTEPMPATQETCNTEPCPVGTWQASAWGECSAVCGGGTQSRTVTCVDAAGQALPGSQCAGAAPAASQTCGEAPCAQACSVAPQGALLLVALALLRARRR